MNQKKIGLHAFMAIPAFMLFIVFFIYPLFKGVGMSLTNWDGVGKAKFIGLQNFVNLLSDDRALADIKTTLLFALGSAPLLNIVGLIYALLMKSDFKGKTLARTCIYLPAIISPLIMGYIWYLLLQPGRGFVYHVFDKIGHASWFGNWLGDYWIAMLVLVLVNVWQYAGMTMVIYLAGLQSIPDELYEAAEIDGASKLRQFRDITLPLLGPSIRINVVTNIIGSLSVFDVVMSLTGGGPGYQTETLSIYIMRMCYGSKTGYSTAVAIIMFFIILVPVIISMKMTKTKE
ncbi:sn-glycerol-3-phosphate transport system permease protein UgpA [Clostridium puniceum]|uniref:sn-glycerol-3-phosphate transport system permease protein UgpA n=1 Tax=Clostridium puniceum TaxID=29367 RepID=A0A1S8T827_9CLOT|nr:sugar ABC transporter permease [Clostridium puniceum]OOM73812.1 sn-glycerol-3-phosphate transport system permease protein UgpA [Clostridium puniceum]